ncbi:hypothetical protein QJS10_CPB22g01232 [Acorus calamus]|uniref:Uncharacterized protein n=1 Tax=Acorus calamus TaxID=4465 RepID=A0AAV9BZV5_ACOCL|nr:hypothetical protein QJS10_CPB22g01232 [Acorus calamus]
MGQAETYKSREVAGWVRRSCRLQAALDGAREAVVVVMGRGGWVAEWEEIESRRL